MNRRAGRKDANQELIVKALRKAGASVTVMDEPVDLLVGYKGRTFLIEVKDGARKPSERRLTPEQQKFFNEWQGGQVAKVETIAGAFYVLGIPYTEA